MKLNESKVRYKNKKIETQVFNNYKMYHKPNDVNYINIEIKEYVKSEIRVIRVS